MYKIYTKNLGRPKGLCHKILLIMRLTTAILLATLMQVSAATFGQRITINQSNVPLKVVLKEIRKQSGYDFLYDGKAIASTGQINVSLNNATIEEALSKVFRDLPFSYEVSDKNVTIKRKEESSFLEKVTGRALVIDVTGRVTDEHSQPLAGATVQVKEQKNSTVTDETGFFMLKKVQSGATLIISFLGHDKMEIIAKSDLGQIKLPTSTSPLDEVKVIAYGQNTKRLSIGNTATIKSADIEKQPVNDPLLALQGKVPGLFITQNTGLPNSSIKVQIEGKNSISNGSDPFYVVDGVPYISSLLKTSGIGTNGLGSPLAFISPSDIESIEILKDADATSIYGSRAANGAILITTKKGAAGPARISFNIQNGWGKVTRMADLLNTQQYLEMRNEALKNAKVSVGATDYDLNGLWDQKLSTNWQKVLIGNTAHYADINGSISGGNEFTQYLVGANYQRQSSVYPGEFSDQKGSVHFSLNTMSNDRKFRMQFSGSYLSDNNTLPGTDLTSLALNLAPNAPSLYNADGTLNWAPNSAGNSTWTNPLSNVDKPYSNKTNNLLANSVLSYKLSKDLDVKSSFGYNSLQSDEFLGQTIQALAPERRATTTSFASYGLNAIKSWIVEPQLNFHKLISTYHHLDLLLGTTFQNTVSKGLRLQGSGFTSDALMKDLKSATSISVINSISSSYRYNAFFGRLNYNYKDKYLFNFSARRDGSSRFGPESRFNNFWSVGAAWILSEEDIFSKIPIISYSKLRISYGTTGNDQIGEYKYMDLFNAVSAGIPYQSVAGIAPLGFANPLLQWEETKKLNIGMDIYLLKDKVSFSIDRVVNRSSNQLVNYSLPSFTGFISVTKNLPATVQNTEWQFLLTSQNIKKPNFSWSSSFNLTLPKNRLVSFPGLETSTYANTMVIGQPIGIVKAYKFIGVDPLTGYYAIADKNGNPVEFPQEADKTQLININFPDIYGGFQNTLRFRQFELSFLIQFVKQTAMNVFGGNGYPGFKGLNQPIGVLSRWQKSGDIALVEQFNTDFAAFQPYVNMRASDVAYSTASYARLKNIAFTYQLSDKVSKALSMRSANLFINGQNLLTVTKFNGLDPETGNLTLPPLKIITLGCKASF